MDNMDLGFEIEMDVIEIEQEDGTLVECGVQDQFEIDDQEYMVLSPIKEDNFLDDEIVYYFRVAYDGEDMMLEDIEDAKELELVKAAYEDFINPEYDDEEASDEE